MEQNTGNGIIEMLIHNLDLSRLLKPTDPHNHSNTMYLHSGVDIFLHGAFSSDLVR